MTTRTIHTNLYSDVVFGIVNKTFNDLGNYGHRNLIRAIRCSTVEQAPDGEVIVKVDPSKINSWRFEKTIYGKYANDQDIRNWIANNIKLITVKDLQRQFNTGAIAESQKAWERDNKAVCPRFNNINVSKTDPRYVDVRTIYAIYDTLKARKNAAKHYPKMIMKKISGSQLDPITAEQITAINEQISKLNTDFDAESNRLYSERYEKIREAQKQLNEEYDRLLQEKKAELDKQLKELHELHDTIIQQAN